MLKAKQVKLTLSTLRLLNATSPANCHIKKNIGTHTYYIKKRNNKLVAFLIK